MNKEFDGYFPVELKNGFLLDLIQSIDMKLCQDDKIIEVQAKKIKELEDEKLKNVQAGINKGWDTMGQTLKACLDVPDDISSIGTVGATMIMKINNMKSMDEVHAYIKRLSKKVGAKKGNKDGTTKGDIRNC